MTMMGLGGMMKVFWYLREKNESDWWTGENLCEYV